ncbi:MAG: toll/interleukin-1 receptor domain-containing protein [Lachnospiraceae bacterium]|nr:toll/interleukin-1 receptor domain-containing protein [Lachnospiraceae bacterium]
MGDLICKTWHDRDPKGLIRALFIAQEEDFNLYYKELTDLILELQNNLAIYHAQEPEDLTEEVIASMRLVIVPVTMAFLHPSCRMRTIGFDTAMRLHIPILPIQKQKGIGRFFSEICGKIQLLDATGTDSTRLDFREQLSHYLANHLVDEEMAKRVRDAFRAYIFLSYRKKDRRHANEIMRLIHENDFMRDVAIWYDEYLVPGEKYNEAIEDAMLKSRLVALVVTPNLVNEDNYVCRVEYPEARRNGKPVLPIEAEPTDRDLMRTRYDGIDVPVRKEDRESLKDALAKAFTDAGMGIADAELLAGEGMRQDDDPEHLYSIGLAYLMGIDVEVDPVRAADLLHRAHQLGSYTAGNLLVDCYLEGAYFAQDYQAAANVLKEMIDYYGPRLQKNKDNYLFYIELVKKYRKIFTDYYGVYNEMVADIGRHVVDKLKEAKELFPDPEDDVIIAQAQKDYIRILCHVPGHEEELDRLCDEVVDLYADYSQRYGYYHAWDLMALAVELSGVSGRNWFELGFLSKQIYEQSLEDKSSEEQMEFVYSSNMLWMAYVESYNNDYLVRVGEAGQILQTETDRAAQESILGNMENCVQTTAALSKWLADTGEEEKRMKLNQRFYKICGTFSVIMRDFDAAGQFFGGAFRELQGQADNPEVMHAQIENCKNLILLGDVSGNRNVLQAAHRTLDDLYGTLYRATGLETYHESMEENRAEMKAKGIEPGKETGKEQKDEN